MNIFTPGKVILSGEHAIVHGRPAVAASLRAGISGTFTPIPEPELRIHAPPLPTLRVPLTALADHLNTVSMRHAAFLEDKLPVTAILPADSDLLLAAAALARPQNGCEVHLRSTLPPGSGLGSSAAVILTLLKGLLTDPDPETLQALALECEHFQHGRSSGLDVAACLHAVPVFGQNGAFSPMSLPPGLPDFRLFHTGKPETSTGECVARVRQTHPPKDPVWDAFEAVTLSLRQALLDNATEAFTAAVRENHRLLVRIGVVPEPVARAIAAIETAGGAAKICGAGAVRGAAAGTVLVIGPDSLPVPETWRRRHVL
jgi:mevalonate kinase